MRHDIERFVLGCWQLGGCRQGWMATDDALALVTSAAEMGVRTFDTASVYGNGRAEVILGHAFERSPIAVSIITKAGYVAGMDGAQDLFEAPPQDFRPCSLRRSLEDSLVRLRRDKVGTFLLHDPSEDVVTDEAVWECLRAAQAEGLVGSIGASTSPRKSALAIERGAEVVEVHYDIDRRGAEDELFPVAERYGTTVLARSPFRGGPLLEEVGASSRRLCDMICFPLSNPIVAGVVVGVGSRAELEEDIACVRREAS